MFSSPYLLYSDALMSCSVKFSGHNEDNIFREEKEEVKKTNIVNSKHWLRVRENSFDDTMMNGKMRAILRSNASN